MEARDGAEACGSQLVVARKPSVHMDKCLLAKQELELPEALIEDVNIFLEVFSAATWHHALTEPQRRHLMKFLPSFPEKEIINRQETLRSLLCGENIKFGNPVKQFHKKLRDGMFSPDIARYAELCRKAKYREYRYQQRVYCSTLLNEILINRQRILEQAFKTAPEEPIRYNHFRLCERRPEQKSINTAVRKKCRKVIQDVNRECGLPDTSSDEEPEETVTSAAPSRSRKPLLKALPPEGPPIPAPRSNVHATFEPIPDPPQQNGHEVPAEPPVKRARSPMEVTEEHFQVMIKRHKKRRLSDPSHPELDTWTLTLEDIIERVQANVKKTSKAIQQRRRLKDKVGKKTLAKVRDKAEARVKVKEEVTEVEEDVKVTPTKMTPPGVFARPDLVLPGSLKESPGEVKVAATLDPEDDSESEEQWSPPPAPPVAKKKENYGLFSNFFCLLRDLICEDDSKLTTLKLEEKVREWQECPTSAAANPWFGEHPNWVEVVASSLKFLAGDVLGLSLENFVPLLDYKERAQQWRWIGRGRDTDADLEPLYKHWLVHKEELMAELMYDGSASPPPARSRSTFIVRSTTEEEKELFRHQERARFESPHRAFTYTVHQYECVVGPVKGVYSKENALNKAREHTLLVNERPPFVTILTLVRDAAARLPNGVGTRSDICELLKDSQFLAPGVTDAQINTVVSGALDRLHYEKDPCVKYDVNRKLWIYLHRARSEDEFERIHRAQGAAVKAKKAMQKPKPVKKGRESMGSSVPSLLSNPVATCLSGAAGPTPSLSRQSSVLSTGSNDSYINVETLSPSPVAAGHSPKGLGPPGPGAMGVSKAVTKGVTVVTTSTPTSPRQTPLTGPLRTVTAVATTPAPVSATPALSTAPRLVAPPVGAGMKLLAGGLPPGTPRVVTSSPGGKPVAMSLLQGQGGGGGMLGSPQAGLTVTAQGSTPRSVPTPAAAGGRATPVAAAAAATTSTTTTTTTLLGAGPRPLTFSLIQTQGGTKLVESLVAGSPGSPRTMLIKTADGKGQKVLTAHPQQHPHTHTLTAAQSPGAVQLQQLSAGGTGIVMATAAGVVTQTASLTTETATVTGGGATLNHPAPTTVTLPGGARLLAAGGKPMLTRLVQQARPGTSQPQQQQVVNISTLLATQAALQKGGEGFKQAVKIQGGTLIHTSGGKPLIQTVGGKPLTTAQLLAGGATVLQRQGSEGGVPSAPGTPTSGTPPTTPGKLAQQITLTRAGKPASVMVTKATAGGGGGGSGKPSTTQTVAQIIQSTALAGKGGAVLGGKTAMLGGKPVFFGGQSFQIGGKPVQLVTGKGGQIGFIQGQGGLSAFNIATQASVTGTSAVGQSALTSLTSLPQGVTVTSPQAKMTPLTSTGAGAGVVTRVVQTSTAHTHQQPGVKTPHLVTLTPSQAQAAVTQHQGQMQTRVSGSGQQQQSVAMTIGGQTKLVTLGQGIQQLANPKAGVSAGGMKSVVVTQGSMLTGGFLLQSPQGKVIAPHQLITGGGLRPAFLSTAGAKGGHNIQLLKTVVSQPGGKPGQTTILLAQSAGATSGGATSIMTTAQHAQLLAQAQAQVQAQTPGRPAGGVTMAGAAGTSLVNTATVAAGGATVVKSVAGQVKGKAPPIYARIITPPPGLRLAAVRPGQAISAQQGAPHSGVGVIQTMPAAQAAAPSGGQATQGQQVTGETPPNATGESQ